MKHSIQYIDVEIDKLINSIDMGLIKEPLDIDFFVDPKPLTKNEIKLISDYIKADKEKRSKLKTSKKKKSTSTQQST